MLRDIFYFILIEITNMLLFMIFNQFFKIVDADLLIHFFVKSIKNNIYTTIWLFSSDIYIYIT